MALRVQRLEPPPEISEPLMAAIAREREAAQRARRGLSASAPRRAPQRNREARRGMGLERCWNRGDRRRGRAHLSAGATARAPRFRRRRSGRAACVSRSRCRSALPALASLLRLAGSAERAGRSLERSSRGARRLQRSACAGERSRRSMASCRPQALEELGARMAVKQTKLRRRANVEFERLFAETPSAFATRIAAYLGHPVSEPEVAQDERPRPRLFRRRSGSRPHSAFGMRRGGSNKLKLTGEKLFAHDSTALEGGLRVRRRPPRLQDDNREDAGGMFLAPPVGAQEMGNVYMKKNSIGRGRARGECAFGRSVEARADRRRHHSSAAEASAGQLC